MEASSSSLTKFEPPALFYCMAFIILFRNPFGSFWLVWDCLLFPWLLLACLPWCPFPSATETFFPRGCILLLGVSILRRLIDSPPDAPSGGISNEGPPEAPSGGFKKEPESGTFRRLVSVANKSSFLSSLGLSTSCRVSSMNSFSLRSLSFFSWRCSKRIEKREGSLKLASFKNCTSILSILRCFISSCFLLGIRLFKNCTSSLVASKPESCSIKEILLLVS